MHARFGLTALLALLLVGAACSSETDGSPDRRSSSGSSADDDDDDDDDGGGNTSSGGKSSSGGGSSGAAGCAANEEQCPRGCAALETDTNNCGSCGNACPTFAGVQVACIKGECMASCDGATEDLCQGGESQLFCIDTANDPNHCGGCGNGACDPVENGTAACVSGQCGARCNTGFSACNGGASCFDLQNDLNNCGTCGRRCLDDKPSGTTFDQCSTGQCRGSAYDVAGADCIGGSCPAQTCEQLCDAKFGTSSSTGGTVVFRTNAGSTIRCALPDGATQTNQLATCNASYTIPKSYECACDLERTW